MQLRQFDVFHLIIHNIKYDFFSTKMSPVSTVYKPVGTDWESGLWQIIEQIMNCTKYDRTDWKCRVRCINLWAQFVKQREQFKNLWVRFINRRDKWQNRHHRRFFFFLTDDFPAPHIIHALRHSFFFKCWVCVFILWAVICLWVRVMEIFWIHWYIRW